MKQWTRVSTIIIASSHCQGALEMGRGDWTIDKLTVESLFCRDENQLI